MSEKNNAAACTAEKPADVCGFTPGPWHEGAGNGEGFIFGPEGCRRDLSGLSPVCRVNGSGPEDAANARLIAAAPELYAALLPFADLLESPETVPVNEDGLIQLWISPADVAKARAALALVRTA